MGENVKPIILNLGCGYKKLVGNKNVTILNVDAYPNCEPDLIWDLNLIPLPFKDNSIDQIYASHIFEHIKEWWPLFLDCARILKVLGLLEIRVPDESSNTALTYRDHHRVFSLVSFHGVQESTHGTSAWAKTEENMVPLRLLRYHQVPHKKYFWMIRWAPRILRFCANHMRNFIHEQVFIFQKLGDRT